MELVHLRTLMNILATFVGVIAIVLIYFFPNYSVLIFSIEVIILPTIYIVFNSYIEENIKQEYQEIISDIGEDSEKMNRKYNEAVFINRELYSKLNELNKKNGRKNKKD